MIKSFADSDTELIFRVGKSAKLPPSIQRSSLRKLRVLDAAVNLIDLKIPYGNHLEKLEKDLAGQWAIRINDQWRLCFEWDEKAGDAYHVYITDYH